MKVQVHDYIQRRLVQSTRPTRATLSLCVASVARLHTLYESDASTSGQTCRSAEWVPPQCQASRLAALILVFNLRAIYLL